MKTNLFFDKITYRGKTIDVTVHPSPNSNAIIINYPGHGGHIDGFNMKYRVLGKYLSDRGIGAFVQMPNIEWKGENYRKTLVEDLRAVFPYALNHASDISASAFPDLYLMGFSAGGGAVAAVAADNAAIKKILLMAPSGDAHYGLVQKSLAKFEGEVYAVIGANDTVVKPTVAKFYVDLALKASHKQHIVIPNCDHQFRGTVNGQIMAKAPLWAFAGDTTFPSPEGGLVLY